MTATSSYYHEMLKKHLELELGIAQEARKKGLDPALQPEIHITKDLAERVEALMGVEGVGARIRDLEREGYGREEIALKIGYDFAEGKFGKYKRVEVIEHAVRTAVAILTEGVVAAPLDGISRVEIGINDDSSEYVKVFYSGPIRSAGGTAQALSILAADYIRRKMGFAAYSPREEELWRYALEVSAYAQIANLQYTPSDDEVKEIVKHCPICVDGEPTEEREVGGYKDLERVATNRIRGGMVLVLTEGIALKAPKIKRHVDKLGIEGWDWLTNLIKAKRAKGKKNFLDDLIAGRPVFGHPAKKGSFRLRYGRARNTGFSAIGMNPDTMSLLGFIAAGTQIKPQLPGKAACVAPVDSIEGPTVKLKNGDLVKFKTSEQECGITGDIAEIVDLGEVLIDYGDFLETGHRLVPGAYSHEWWLKELAAKSQEEAVKWLLQLPTQKEAIEISSRYDVPLHPAYTYLWEDITEEDRKYLTEWISGNGFLERACEKYDNKVTLYIPEDERVRVILEDLLVLYYKKELGKNDSQVPLLTIEWPDALLRCLGLNDALKSDSTVAIKTRAKAPTRIGMRMGRPEKSRERMMTPAPHAIFPLGDAGGKSRSLKEALKRKEIEVEIGMRRCRDCGHEFLACCSICDRCGSSNFRSLETQTVSNNSARVRTINKGWNRDNRRSIDLWHYYEDTIKKLGDDYDITKQDVKCVTGLIPSRKVPEHLGKGILRAKHGVFVFKDGTIRYDFTNLPLTHFKPIEIGLSVERAKALGYSHDIEGGELINDTQILELKQQDIIISVNTVSYLLKVTHFLDELLERFYGLSRYYKVSSNEDLVGQLVLGLAPHTSAGILGRIIGFTRVSACYAHPFFHAAKRRNCDGDEDSVILLLDALLNFSLSFLPDKIGGRMDAPLVLIPFINPKEVDKEAHNVSITKEYPLSFYEAAASGESAKEQDIETAVTRIEEPKDVYGFRYTNETSDIAAGPLNSLYKTLNSMQDKMDAQLRLATIIRAVDEREVAEMVIKNHFLRDIKGNLRAFGSQKVRCSKCNAKYRRIPLSGKCNRCGSKLLPTVHVASIKKYLGISLRIVNEYHITDYTRQRLELLKNDVDLLFPVEEKQKSLCDFM
ncbi:MAG: DNA polymerase II large subunit [Halobacteriota archaeon]